MTNRSITDIVQPGRRYRLPDGTIARAVAFIDLPHMVGLHSLIGQRSWMIEPEGRIAERLTPDELVAQGFSRDTCSTRRTPWTLFDLTPVFVAWEQASLQPQKSKAQVLEELAGPASHVQVALVIDISTNCGEGSSLQEKERCDDHDIIRWELDHVLQAAEAPRIRLQVASGADPQDVRRLVQMLEDHLDACLDYLVRQRQQSNDIASA